MKHPVLFAQALSPDPPEMYWSLGVPMLPGENFLEYVRHAGYLCGSIERADPRLTPADVYYWVEMLTEEEIRERQSR